ncbi:MAG: iron ABC transporter [Flavobacteriales bacterium]|jgi:cobalamin transport system permease protein|nr:iron ABC transporter [Flavobacteriales bacterium]|tara:strand:+ start:17585 stop:18568 length:984 start_codon:yes stop_codon:yes gene_type:complete
MLFMADLALGSVYIPLPSIVDILLGNEAEKESWNIILLSSRLPRAIAAILAGSALAVSGLQMQTLFRNPLAGPYILGISSGAGLGVAVFIMGFSVLGISLSSSVWFANYGIVISAILGAVLVLLLLMAAIAKLKDIMTVLILGIMIGSIATAFISILEYFSQEDSLKSFVLWTMGDLSSVAPDSLKMLFFIVMIGLVAAFTISKQLNAYLLGEDYAQSLGTNVNVTRYLVILVTALLAGSITAFCGPIGFVGIITPHIARMFFKSANHFYLVPLCVLLGINIMLLADIIAQLPGSDKTFPINAVTSLIGIPFIFWIIFRNKKIAALN